MKPPIVSCLLLLMLACSTPASKQMIKPTHFNADGSIFLKLYKAVDTTYDYWEVWNTDSSNAVIHWGVLGEMGSTRDLRANGLTEMQTEAETLIQEKLNEGYQEISADSHYTVAVTFKLKTWGSDEDLEQRQKYMSLITENLGWTGNGRCDDGDIGSGEMAVYAEVVNPHIAVKTINRELQEKKVPFKYYFSISRGDSLIAEKTLPKEVDQ